MIKLVLPILLCCASLGAAIIPSDRRTDWSVAGVRGGIPTFTNIYVMRAPGVSLATLNNDLQNCPTGSVVLLTNGLYSFNSQIDFGRSVGVVLRGMGPTNTFITFTANPAAGNIAIGAETDRLNPGGIKNWTSGFSQGGTTLTLSNVTGLPALGHIIAMDQLNDGVLVEDDLGDGGDYTSRLSGERAQCQYAILTASNGNNITIAPGLHMMNWRISQVPQVWWWNNTDTMMSGVESLTITNGDSAGSTAILIQEAHDCWVKDVRSYNNPTDFVRTIQCLHVTVDGCDLISAASGGSSQAYGVTWFMTSSSLMINCYSWQMAASYVDAPQAQGNVCAFNYFTNSSYDGINIYWDIAAISSHDAHSCMNLHEGNWCNKAYMDNDHGSESHCTEFRNRYHGKQADPRIHNTMAYDAQGWCRSNNLVGNLLGTVGYHTHFWTTNAAMDDELGIIVLGNDGQPGWGNDIPGSTYIHGNWDSVSGAQSWNADNADHTIPNSLAFSSKPAWWPRNLPWPPYDPANPTSNSPTNIPAGHRAIFGTNAPPGEPESAPGPSRLVASNVRALRISGRTPPPSPLMVVDTNWLAFGTNLNGVTNDLTVWVTNAGTAQLDGTASASIPFSVLTAASYSLATNTATNVVIRYTRGSPANDTNQLVLTGGGGATVHLSGTSTNVPDLSQLAANTNWLNFGTNLSAVTNDMTVWVTNTGSTTLSGSASTASPFSLVNVTNYAISASDATNIVVRYTRSGTVNDTNELALTGGGGTNIHLSGYSTNAPGTGPNQWYYGVGSDSYPNLASYYWASVIIGDEITCTAGGSITKLSMRCENVDTEQTIRCTLWKDPTSSGTWTFHECVTITVTASSSVAWRDGTLSTPLTVADGEKVRVMGVVSVDGNVGYYKSGDTGGYRDSRTYANGCITTQPSWGDDEQTAVRVYVD